jgi:hypothetical protein
VKINSNRKEKIIKKIEEIKKNGENIKEVEKIGLDYIEILIKDKVDELFENIENCFSFTTILLIYSIISTMFFMSVSIFLYIKTDRYGFPIIFFIFSIPIIVGIIIFGIKHGIKKSIDGIKGIVSFISQIIREVEKKNKESENKKEKINVIIQDIILPIIKIAVSQRVFGIVIYKLIENIIDKFIKKIQEYEKRENINSENSKNRIIEKAKDISEIGAKLAEKLLNGIYMFLTITGVLFCLTGIIFIIILLIVRLYIIF